MSASQVIESSNPEVEFFSEEIEGIEYLNVGLKFEKDGKTKRCVLGAFQGDISQEAMTIIKGLVEQACLYTLGLDGLEIVCSECGEDTAGGSHRKLSGYSCNPDQGGGANVDG